MNISVIAKSSFAIVAVVALIAMLGYINTRDPELLAAAKTIAVAVIVGGVLIAALIHLPRFLR